MTSIYQTSSSLDIMRPELIISCQTYQYGPNHSQCVLCKRDILLSQWVCSKETWTSKKHLVCFLKKSNKLWLSSDYRYENIKLYFDHHEQIDELGLYYWIHQINYPAISINIINRMKKPQLVKELKKRRLKISKSKKELKEDLIKVVNDKYLWKYRQNKIKIIEAFCLNSTLPTDLINLIDIFTPFKFPFIENQNNLHNILNDLKQKQKETKNIIELVERQIFC